MGRVVKRGEKARKGGRRWVEGILGDMGSFAGQGRGLGGIRERACPFFLLPTQIDVGFIVLLNNQSRSREARPRWVKRGRLASRPY